MIENRTKKKLWSAGLLLAAIAVGILLNVVGKQLNTLIGLPFYLDNIGTILTAAAGGYIPCVTVGFFTNIINGISSPVTTYYCIISVFIAVAAVWCMKKKLLNRFPQVILSVTIFALLGGVAGGALTWLIGGMDFGEGVAVDMAASINHVLPLGYFVTNLLSAFILDFADKAIVTAISLGIYYLLPKTLLADLRRQSWYLIREENAINKKSRRGLSLSVKASLLVTLSIALVGTSAIAISIIQFHDSTVQDYTNKGNQVTAILDEMLTEKSVNDLLENGRDAKEYEHMSGVLQSINRASPEIKFFYAYKVNEENCQVIFDMDVHGIKGHTPGTIIEHDKSIKKYLDLFLKGEEVPPDEAEDEYGWLLSVYRPIYDGKGHLLCYAITDLSMERLRSEEIAFLTRLISLFVGFLLLVRTFAVWLTQKHIVRPMNRISNVVSCFSYDTPEAREESMKMVEALDIRSGDEIAHLYNAYRKTTADMVDYINEVQHQKNQIANIQAGLILVLAEMVENRDKNTGDHVKKTAAYVSIILNKMREEGIYADQLSDEFIYDVVHSAPLHDVGKIKVSDTILNKPGKLTNEEFAIMKSHTTAGREIIDMVIDTIREESDYLMEARNLAAYHHEKWDGSGYPCGLVGEEIPLSARVMAVADVFDALVSRRSYKEPFTIEKAFDIIREGDGRHFDPMVVHAFFDAEEEIRKVAGMDMSTFDYKQTNL